MGGCKWMQVVAFSVRLFVEIMQSVFHRQSQLKEFVVVAPKLGFKGFLAL